MLFPTKTSNVALRQTTKSDKAGLSKREQQSNGSQSLCSSSLIFSSIALMYCASLCLIDWESQHSIICSVIMAASDVLFILDFAFGQIAVRKGKENRETKLCSIVFTAFAPNLLCILKMVAIIPFEPLFLRNRNPIFWILSFLRIPYVLTMDEIGERLQRFDNFVRRISGHYNGCFVSVLMAFQSFGMHMLIVMD